MPFAVVGRGELSVPASINDDMRLLPCLYMYSEIGGQFFAASDEKRVRACIHSDAVSICIILPIASCDAR